MLKTLTRNTSYYVNKLRKARSRKHTSKVFPFSDGALDCNVDLANDETSTCTPGSQAHSAASFEGVRSLEGLDSSSNGSPEAIEEVSLDSVHDGIEEEDKYVRRLFEDAKATFRVAPDAAEIPRPFLARLGRSSSTSSLPSLSRTESSPSNAQQRMHFERSTLGQLLFGSDSVHKADDSLWPEVRVLLQRQKNYEYGSDRIFDKSFAAPCFNDEGSSWSKARHGYWAKDAFVGTPRPLSVAITKGRPLSRSKSNKQH
mmetsp:Transcript_40671/g.63659  ORF Transcript_40671/g.63659 Transcript_40671/m.63659 type:complete len:257 (-) Transcript_40671:167-937(-)